MMSGAGVGGASMELDFFGMEKGSGGGNFSSSSSQSQFQKLLQQNNTTNGVQTAISKINPQLLKTVINGKSTETFPALPNLTPELVCILLCIMENKQKSANCSSTKPKRSTASASPLSLLSDVKILCEGRSLVKSDGVAWLYRGFNISCVVIIVYCVSTSTVSCLPY
ncbi:hypothetical protein MKW94_022101 [Papaver nudicaule]|uniref:Uncharacterized protein n=1 Tax=Papaver nudicaule TaxID=74823 RepID=A0AA41S4Y7_PAPNU|nr:hypothetical protein [Papaver nudicaule]